jgi:hypothetical protein
LCPQRRHSYATSYNELVDRKLDRRTGRRCCRHRASWRGRQSRGSSWHARNARLKLFNQRPEGSAGFRNRPLDRVAPSSCVRSFRPVLYEAATGAAPARTSLWSLDLQPRQPLHTCALTAENILLEHSSEEQARTVAATGTALPFPLWRRESGLLGSQSAHRNN